MKTIPELLKERMLIRSSDPERSNVIMMIVDGAKKLAKEEHRDPEERDLAASVKSQIKQTEKAITQIRDKGGDSALPEKELEILKSFLPASLNEAQTRILLEKLVAELPEAERTKKSLGKIMAGLKTLENLDLSLAGKLLGGMLR